jgi:choline dehydrogenase
MHSGIGPESTLTAYSIPVVSSLPGVGAHLQDHPLVNMRFSVKNVKDSLQFLNAKPEAGFTKDVAKALLELMKWQWWGKGSLTCNVSA